MSVTTNYSWPLLATNQASPEVSHNAALVAIDAKVKTLDDDVSLIIAYDPAGSPPLSDIPVKTHTAMLVHAGAAGAYTLQNPIPGTDDGKRVEIISKTHYAHVVTCDVASPPYSPINETFSTITFDTLASPPTAAIGNSIVLRAYQGYWYTVSMNGVTLS